ncbi:MAG TPA: SCO family protein [Burkholderiaceae bacterium]|nr:SCO family protein [Burkholderiaceae bacterium]
MNVKGIVLSLLCLLTAPAHAHGTKALESPSLSATPHLAVIRKAPNFTLIDTNGQPLQLAQLRGRIVVLSFVFTECGGACPLVTQQMRVLQQALLSSGLGPERVMLLSVTVDPEGDTAAVLADYAKRFDARPGWSFLRDAPARLRAVLAAYDEWTRKLPNGSLDHPARIYLIDPAGRVREIYALAFFDERQALIDIQALEREHRASSAR